MTSCKSGFMGLVSEASNSPERTLPTRYLQGMKNTEAASA